MRLTRTVFVTVTLVGMAQLAAAQSNSVFPGDTGPALAAKVRAAFAPTSPTTNYKAARQKMFNEVDGVNGRCRLLYTPEDIVVNGQIPPGGVANCEHVWAQNRFENAAKRAQIKCDLHHIYPSRPMPNGVRSNNPFADIPDTQTTKWFQTNTPQTAPPPPASRDQFSEAVSSQFEPREAHKGDVARAMFYVSVIYGDQALNTAWFSPQVNTLLQWNAADLPDAFDLGRSDRVRAIQGNRNPFVTDPTLPYRIHNRPVPPEVAAWVPPTATPAPAATPAVAVAPGRGTAVAAPGVRIAHWNAREIFTVADVTARAADFQAFAAEVRPDVLTLVEVTSYKQVERVRDLMGLAGYHIAVSNFVPDNTDEHASFEVAILSRFTLDGVVEFDPTPDNGDDRFANAEDGPEPDDEVALVPPDLPGLADNARPSRGYLFARIDALKLTVRATHLKSSGGSSGAQDRNNARKREVVAAAIAAAVAKDRADRPDYTAVVTGDMNVGERDTGKNGTSLTDDTADGYDDTHALFAGGLVGGLRMTSLTRDVGRTFAPGNFGNVGPIDSIYVAGPKTDKFDPATRTSRTFGSDHFGVWTVLRP